MSRFAVLANRGIGVVTLKMWMIAENVIALKGLIASRSIAAAGCAKKIPTMPMEEGKDVIFDTVGTLP